MKAKIRIIMVIATLSLMVICQSAMAHNLWLNPDNYYPQVGSTVTIGIGWGHKYPADRVDQEVKADRVESISAVDPDGLPVALTQTSATFYKLSIKKAGAYQILAGIKPGFFTMTAEGRKWGDKKSVENPIKCTNFHIEAKTVIMAGGTDKNLGYFTGNSLEMIPLTNLQTAGKGDKLAVRVLFDGKPLPNASVKATYAGFESQDMASHGAVQKNAKAGADEKAGKSGKPPVKRFPVETVTDESGEAVVPLDRSGYWMILLSHKPPFADTQICDEHMYHMAFTLEIGATP
ncbi:MAG: DUF4198 domain-containing protein [Desulfobacterales bacterium]|jgi:uncharacterized GH25 family protein|nr:DUF4198 domain-containing protein [Desulfobacterales bacterium]